MKLFKTITALLIVATIGVGFTASTGITVKTVCDTIFGVNQMPVSYSELPFDQEDGIIEAGAKSADYIFGEMEKAQDTIDEYVRNTKNMVGGIR